MSAPEETRAGDELVAAHVLAVSGLTAQAVGVALRAALHAAEAALLVLDRVPPAEAGGVVAAFARHVVRERGIDAEAGHALRLLLNRQYLAEVARPPQAEAEAAIAEARTVIETVAAWVEHARQVARERATPPR